MAKVLWLNWSGGGNLPPSLGIARVLSERGHEVAFAGRPEMVPRVKRAGFRAIEVSRSYEQALRYPNKWIPRAASFLTSPAVAEEISDLVPEEAPDLLIVDAMFPVALVAAKRFKGPNVVICHTCVNRMLAPWRNMLAMLGALRVEAGFDPLPTALEDLWMSRDELLVTTLEELDRPPAGLAPANKIHHVGPVLEAERNAAPVTLPWSASDPTPLVLVSFSTMPEQGSVPKFQRTIDAIAGLAVHAVVTVGDSIDAGALAPAANVAVFATADHDALMRQSSLVVTHGGHGIMMRALKHGLPMVVIPGLASDQPVNAAAVQTWGAGKALPPDATTHMIRAAIEDVLGSPQNLAKAQQLSQKLVGVDGAANAADELERQLRAA